MFLGVFLKNVRRFFASISSPFIRTRVCSAKNIQHWNGARAHVEFWWELLLQIQRQEQVLGILDAAFALTKQWHSPTLNFFNYFYFFLDWVSKNFITWSSKSPKTKGMVVLSAKLSISSHLQKPFAKPLVICKTHE